VGVFHKVNEFSGEISSVFCKDNDFLTVKEFSSDYEFFVYLHLIDLLCSTFQIK